MWIGDDVGKLEQLEGQYRAALDKFKHKKKNARQLEGDLQVLCCIKAEYSVH